MVQRGLLQPGIVAHVDRSPRFSHHDTIGAGKGFRDSVHTGRLVVPFGIITNRLALNISGVGPVNTWTPFSFMHGSRSADNKYRYTVNICIIYGKIGMQQADQVVENRYHRLTACLGIAMGDLNSCLFVLAQHHFRIILAVIDDRVVQAPIARTRIQCCMGQIVHVQHINNNIRAPSLLCRHNLRFFGGPALVRHI